MNRRRWIIVLVLGCGLIALPGAGFFHHWRLKRAVAAYESELAGKGMKLGALELAPKTSREATDAGARLWAAMTQMSGIAPESQPNCLRGIAAGRAAVSWQQDPLLSNGGTNIWPRLSAAIVSHHDALRAACTVIESESIQFDLNYARGFNMLLPHLGQFKKVTQMLSAAMVVELHSNNTDRAWQYLRAIVRLQGIYDPEPTMISHLVNFATTSIAWSATWEALHYPSWTDEQLAELQQLWAAADFLAGTDTVFGMERAFTRMAINDLRASQKEWVNLSSGVVTAGTGGRASTLGDLIDEPGETVQEWGRRYLGYWPWRWWDSYEEELYGAKVCQSGIEASKVLQSQRSYRAADLSGTRTNLNQAFPHAQKRFVLVSWHDGMGDRFLIRAVTAQTQREMILAGIALHRYRRRHGDWPTNLSQLQPAFLQAVPVDYMDGQPLRYSRKDDGSFLLYSVGKDMQDYGGNAQSSTSNPQVWQGKDWVWPEPATKEEIAAFWKTKGKR